LAHLDDVLLFIQNHSIDIMTLSETWLDDTVSDLEICPPHYGLSIVRRDRNRRGGGVAVIFSNHVHYRSCFDLSEGNVESLWVELFPNSKRAALMCCAYRSPSDCHFFDNFMMECEKGLLSYCQKLVILGDLNSNLALSSSQQTKFLRSFMNQFHLYELVQSPTRVTATSSSQLDLILTNSPFNFQNTAAVPFSGSDHHVVVSFYCARGISQSCDHKIVYSWQYHKLNGELLDSILLDDSWSIVFDVDNVNVCAEAFTLVMQHFFDVLLPVRKLRVKRCSNPWSCDSAIAAARRKRDWLHRRALKSADPADWSAYRRCRNKVTAMTRSAKQQYLLHLVSDLKKTSPKFWNQFKYLSSRSKADHHFLSDVSLTCEDFNRHFVSVAQKTISDLPSVDICPLSYITSVDVPAMHLTEVDVLEISELILKLDSHKAMGVDAIPTRFIKASPVSMAALLVRLINKSISSSTFPDCWKAAIVTPVLKSHKNFSLSNFRPISVLPIFSKVLERVVSDQIVDHFHKYNLFSQKQSGFRHGYSTQDVLLHVVNSCYKAIDRGQYAGAVFLDLAKAFDCVNHAILLKKLTAYGICGGVHSWLKSFLCGRTQRVVFKGNLSSEGSITVGVPQGSILGPLLFSIYVNDLPNVVHSSDLNMFADDTELHYCHSDLLTVEHTLHSDLGNISTWLKVNRLKLNVSKSHCMLIGSRQRIAGKCLHLMLDGVTLGQVSSTKYLGIHIDQHLTWNTHIDYILHRIRSKLYCINRLRPVSSKILRLLYQAYIMPILDYCDVVWSPCSALYTRRLERIHSKFVSSLPASTSALFDLRLSLIERRTYHTAVQVYKILHELTPPYLHGMFHYASAISGRIGRNPLRLYVPGIRTNYGRGSLWYRGTTIWNNLPIHVTAAQSVAKFKCLYFDFM